MTGMADPELGGSSVEISNTADNMIATMHRSDRGDLRTMIARVIADARKTSSVTRLRNYPDVFVARGHGLRVIFKTGGEKVLVTTVAEES